MVCNKCGTVLDDDAIFCPECGNKVGGVEEAPAANDSVAIDEERPFVEGATQIYDMHSDATVIVEKTEAEVNEVVETVEAPVSEAINTAEEIVNTEADNVIEEVIPAEGISEEQVLAAPVNDIPVPETHRPSKFCGACGAENDIDATFCGACGASFASENPSPANVSKEPKDKKNNKFIIAIVAAIVAIAALACILIFVVLPNVGKKSGSTEGLFYLKDNEIVQYQKKQNMTISDRVMEDDDEQVGSHDLYNAVQLSDDGKYIYYIRNYNDYSFDLYRKNLNSKKDDGEKLDSSVYRYRVLDNGSIVYCKDSSDKKLYVMNSKGEKTKVDDSVAEFRVSENEKYILWRTDSSDDNKVYYIDTALKNEKTKLDGEVDSILRTTDNFEEIYYSKEDSVYLYSDLSDKNKIISEYDYITTRMKDNDIVIYYTVETDETSSENAYDIFIDDNMASADAALTEPKIEDYQHEEIQDSYWGQKKTIVTDDKYYELVDEYQAKLNRDAVREELKNMEVSLSSAELYVYADGTKTKLSDSLISSQNFLSVSGVGIGYRIPDMNTIDKISFEKASNMTYSECRETFETMIEQAAELHVNVMGTTDIVIDYDRDDYSYCETLYADLDSKTCYVGLLESGDSKTEVLFKTSIQKADGELVKINDDFDGYAVCVNGHIYYMSDKDSKGIGDLYMDDKRIDSDVYSFEILGDKVGILYITDIDNSYAGTVKIYKGSEPVKVCDDVSVHYSSDSGDVAVLTDYNSKKHRGDLSLFKGGKLQKIDSEVNAVLYFE